MKIKTKKMKKTNNVRLVFRFLENSVWYFVLAMVFALLVSLTELVNPKIIGITVDSILGEEPFPAILQSVAEKLGGAAQLRTELWIIALVVIGVAVLAVICRYCFRVFNSYGAETLVETMRNDVFAHIEQLPFSWHSKNNTGDIIQRCTSDIDMIKRFLSEQLTSIFRIIMQITLSMIFMFMIHPKMALVALAFVPMVVSYSAIFHKKIGTGFEKCDENEGKLSAIAQENLTGVRVVRAFGRESAEKQKFESQNRFYTGLWTHLMRLMAIFWSSADLISGIQVLLIIVLGAVFAVGGELTPGNFITFVSYNSMLVFPVRQLGRMISEMSKAGISMERIAYIMNEPIETDTPGSTECSVSGDICFDHVSFAYDPKSPILEDVSFTIREGTTFGILGATGSGKSTLAALLTRLYPLENGKITIGGRDIRSIPMKHLRRNIGLVLQEPYLFSRSLSENIGITEKVPVIEDVRAAAETACLDSAVEGFTKGYDTFVGERGVTLSGGQKQRTAIAQMLIRKTPVMVFDDSLSAVDSETDAKIRHALKTVCKGSTVLLISHRITTIMHADCILIMDHGKVAGIGTHEELLHSNSLYKKICDIQFSGIPTEETKGI